MASVSLFRRWRSQRFQDLVGQGPVVQTLRNILAGGSPARAYLFCGPRGTGKTSSARIFAKALNCERGSGQDPCNECAMCRQITEGSCLDVLEIDAASHTQVEKVRDFIVDKVHFAPVSARYKVYIIDEVHKLSSASFNALLKTLEEPPPHVVFILATTHPHEILPTILSRCQRHDFRPLSLGTIRERLLEVAGVEGLALEPEAADLVARAADGSLRDALVFLEQCVAYAGDSISAQQAQSVLGLVGGDAIATLVRALSAGQPGVALEVLQALVERGLDLKRLLSSLLDVLRCLLLIQAGASDQALTQRLEHECSLLTDLARDTGRTQVLSWLRTGMTMAEEAREFTDLRLLWEVNLVRMACPELEPGLEAVVSRLERLERRAGRMEPRREDSDESEVPRLEGAPQASPRAPAHSPATRPREKTPAQDTWQTPAP
ncbi:MAG: DNA polymerase III subunit gamma/tau, partial [Candidatus Eremiobacterota bacterium]